MCWATVQGAQALGQHPQGLADVTRPIAQLRPPRKIADEGRPCTRGVDSSAAFWVTAHHRPFERPLELVRVATEVGVDLQLVVVARHRNEVGWKQLPPHPLPRHGDGERLLGGDAEGLEVGSHQVVEEEHEVAVLGRLRDPFRR
jgi:hypothetical protein